MTRQFWISKDIEGYALGIGDKQLATGLDRDTAMLFKNAPEMLKALKLLLDHRGMAGSSSWSIAKGIVDRMEAKT